MRTYGEILLQKTASQNTLSYSASRHRLVGYIANLRFELGHFLKKLVFVFSCENQNKCAIIASASTFRDPCPGTGKYLEVSYLCEPGVVRTS